MSNTSQMIPIRSANAVTPNDSADLSHPCRALLVAVSGDVKVDMKDNGSAVTVYLTAGVWIPMEVTRVYATDTVATGIVAGW